VARIVFLYAYIFYLAPQCGHCVSAAPEFEKGARLLEGVINFAAVDMTKYGNVGSKYNIRGYPTFKFFGDNKNSPIDYSG
jgi:protein disulfide-isomerase A6